MRYDYFIGYLPNEYIKYFCLWYIVIFIISLVQTFDSKTDFSLLGLIFTREPFIQVSSYFGIVLAWNYAKAEQKWGRHSKRSIIYFKSISFLYLTMVTINLISALYTRTGLDLGLLAVHGYAFYAVCFIYTLVTLHELRKGRNQATSISFLQSVGCVYIVCRALINMSNDDKHHSYHGHYIGRYSHGEHGSHGYHSRPHVSRFRFRH